MQPRHGKKLTNAAWDKIEEINQLYDAESQRRFLQKIMREDKVDLEEAVRLTQEDPMYSLGWKMCSPAVMMSLTSRKGRERFRKWLTPEEDEIFMKEVVPMNLKSAVKTEFKMHGIGGKGRRAG